MGNSNSNFKYINLISKDSELRSVKNLSQVNQPIGGKILFKPHQARFLTLLSSGFGVEITGFSYLRYFAKL